jgi:hypothetical protein
MSKISFEPSYKGLRKNDNPDQPLQVEVKNKVLSISIGVNTLVFVYKHKPRTVEEKEFSITNIDGFAKDVANELHKEEEDGSTPVHLLLDKAIEAATINGSFFVEEK